MVKLDKIVTKPVTYKAVIRGILATQTLMDYVVAVKPVEGSLPSPRLSAIFTYMPAILDVKFA